MNIALDVMGGDNSPAEVVLGAVEAAREYDCTVSLVGKPEIIRAELNRHKTTGLRLPIVPAGQVIEMGDKPANAVRAKPDNSMSVGCRLVKSGEAHAFVTAGNTGGALAAGILHVGRIKGILRPALVTPLPTLKGHCVVLDIGANADCRPEYFPQFAIMGTLYAQVVLGITNPSVRILSNGEEDGKGNQLVVTAAHMLVDTPGIRFEGNIESKDVFNNLADVVVTDGFTGNIFLKTGESAVRLLQSIMREEIKRRPFSLLGGLMIRKALTRVRARIDDSEFGGAVLLGLSGIVVVAHGRSNSVAIRNAMRVARQAAAQDVPGKIAAAVERDQIHAQLGQQHA